MFSPAFLDELRARTTLSTLIGHSMKLTKAGTEYKGCCPFHQEKTPSFWVNDAKAFYHCFGCAAHGDAIRWMTEQQGVPFVDAVKELAAAAGLEIPASDPRQAERDREREEMLGLMARAVRHYRDRAEHGLDYRRSRGISDAAAATFEIGAAPRPNRAPPLHGAMKDVPVERLIALGLVKRRTEGERAGEIYDVFRGRLMFPIHDARGRPIAFGGRIIGQGEPKYLNSPDTPLFDKGRTLFNLHRAAPAARKSGRLIVVEGYMDVIAFDTAGVAEAVAPNGTAMTEAQIGLAWTLAGVPILCFDGDTAGRKAAAKAAIRALPILEAGKSLSFVHPPAGKDPDDVLREGGAGAVEALLAAPRPLVDVLWQHELEAEPCATPEEVAGLKKRLREHIRVIRNNDVRLAYGQEIAKRLEQRFGAGSAAPRVQINRKPAERQPFSPRQRPMSGDAKAIAKRGVHEQIERALISGLLRYPDVAREDSETIGTAFFRLAEMRQIRDVILYAALANRLDGDIDGLGDLQRWVDFAETGPLRLRFTREPRDAADEAGARADLIEAFRGLVP